MAFGDGRIVRLDLLKVSQLIQPLDAELPVLLVVELSFFNYQLAANHFVTGSRVSRELYAAHGKLLALVNFNIPRDQLLLFIEGGRREGRIVDESLGPVGVLEVFQSLR